MATKKSNTTSKRHTASKSTSSRSGSHAAEPLTDHDQIQQWAEDRGAKPCCVKKTGSKSDVGMIRLEFPGYSGEETLQPISWDEWFEKFDESHLALIVQETTAAGEKSNFNKLVKRDSVEHPARTRTAR